MKEINEYRNPPTMVYCPVAPSAQNQNSHVVFDVMINPYQKQSVSCVCCNYSEWKLTSVCIQTRQVWRNWRPRCWKSIPVPVRINIRFHLHLPCKNRQRFHIWLMLHRLEYMAPFLLLFQVHLHFSTRDNLWLVNKLTMKQTMFEYINILMQAKAKKSNLIWNFLPIHCALRPLRYKTQSY